MSITTKDEKFSIMSALNALKNRIGLSKLTTQFYEFAIHDVYDPHLIKDRGKLIVFYDYVNNCFTNKGEYGKTIYIATLHTDRFKKKSWKNAIKESASSLNPLKTEIGNYLYDAVNKNKDKLILLHSNGGIKNINNTNLYISVVDEYSGYLEPKHISLDAWFDLFCSEIHLKDKLDSKLKFVCLSTEYSNFKTYFNELIFNAFDNSKNFIRAIEEECGIKVAYHPYIDEVEEYSYLQLINKYNLEKILEYDMTYTYYPDSQRFVTTESCVSYVRQLEKLSNEKLIITSDSLKSKILDLINFDFKCVKYDTIEFFNKRCTDFFIKERKYNIYVFNKNIHGVVYIWEQKL